MKTAEGLVLLVHKPLSAIEIYLNHILGVSPAVEVLHQVGIFNLDFEWNLEKMRPLHRTVLSAGFDVVDKDLGRIETVAEAALHRQGVLKHPLDDLKTA